MSDFDREMMEKAFGLALRGEGAVSPNPLVGAVLVREGRVIGEGFHRAFGGAHAEAEAILAAAEPVEGSTLYCNLEPCSYRSIEKHQGPCTELIIRHRIARVCIACRDPNSRVDGAGSRALRAAGIEVEEGLLESRGRELNEIYFHAVRAGTPFVHLKLAQSLDGKIATASGDSKWITNVEARRRVHELRARYDAVLVGSGTVRADDPELTVRLCPGRNPLRVILTSRLDIPLSSKLFSDQAIESPIVFHAGRPDAETAGRRMGLERLGARVIAAPADANGKPEVGAVLELLFGLGVRSVLVEGGSGIFTSFIGSGNCQRLSAFIAPILVGEGTSAIAGTGTQSMAAAPRLREVRHEIIGDQVLVTGRRDVHGYC